MGELGIRYSLSVPEGESFICSIPCDSVADEATAGQSSWTFWAAKPFTP
jgi:hypothetical protein